MLLNYNFHENLINSETSHNSGGGFEKGEPPRKGRGNVDFHLVSEKINIPAISGNLARKRLTLLLDNFSKRFCATLVNGRAGTGKTTLACEFARNYQSVSWFTVGSTDADWKTFSRYFLSALSKSFPELTEKDFGDYLEDSKKQNVQKFVEAVIYEIEKLCNNKSFLIVLDDVHNVFDAKWFEPFFKEMLAYNFPNIAIIFLSRTSPPFPIWRLRSKQKLGYLDEKLLLFTKKELQEIINKNGVSKNIAEKIHRKSFGRISKVIELAGLVAFKDS